MSERDPSEMAKLQGEAIRIVGYGQQSRAMEIVEKSN